MQIAEYLKVSAQIAVDPQRKALFFHGLYVDEIDHVYFAFVRKAACAHIWLQTAARRSLKPGDPRTEVLRWASEHAHACLRLMTYELKEPDLFLPEPPQLVFGPFDADGPEPWMALGLSALLLELMLLRAGKLGHEKSWQFESPLHALGHAFRIERAYALAEAGRRASSAKNGEKRLRSAIKDFCVPGEAAWSETFITEAVTALSGRIESRTEVLHDAIKAIHEADGLPRNAWEYLEPQFDRHAKLLKEHYGFGPMAKIALRLGMKLIRA